MRCARMSSSSVRQRDPGRRAVPAPDRLQRHLRIDRCSDPALRGRLDRPEHRAGYRPLISDNGEPGRASSLRLRSPHVLGAGAVLHGETPDGACRRSFCFSPSSARSSRPPASSSWRSSAPTASTMTTSFSEPPSGASAPRSPPRRLVALAPFPGADHRRCRRRRGRRPVPRDRPWHRPAGRRARPQRT